MGFIWCPVIVMENSLQYSSAMIVYADAQTYLKIYKGSCQEHFRNESITYTVHGRFKFGLPTGWMQLVHSNRLRLRGDATSSQNRGCRWQSGATHLAPSHALTQIQNVSPLSPISPASSLYTRISYEHGQMSVWKAEPIYFHCITPDAS